MDGKRLQTETMRRDLGPALRYLGRMIRRMERTGFPEDDPLYVAALKAYNELHAVQIRLHYLGCDAR
jgi:hypothetical protein